MESRPRFGHPVRQQRQCMVRLADDQVLGAGVALGADGHDRLAVARMERIVDLDLKPQTPGSMTLVCPASASRTWRRRSVWP